MVAVSGSRTSGPSASTCRLRLASVVSNRETLDGEAARELRAADKDLPDPAAVEVRLTTLNVLIAVDHDHRAIVATDVLPGGADVRDEVVIRRRYGEAVGSDP